MPTDGRAVVLRRAGRGDVAAITRLYLEVSPSPSISVSTTSDLGPRGWRGWQTSAAAPSASSRSRPPIRTGRRSSLAPRRRNWDWPCGMAIGGRDGAPAAGGTGDAHTRRGSSGCVPSSCSTASDAACSPALRLGCWPLPKAGRACPLVTPGRCRPAEEADLVVSLLPAGDPNCAAVLAVHQRRWPYLLARPWTLVSLTSPGPRTCRGLRPGEGMWIG